MPNETEHNRARNAQIKAIRKALQTEDPWKEHGKWLFTSASVVGTLAGAFQLLGGLAGPDRLLLGVAVLSLGVSLVSATVALTPKWHELHEDPSEKRFTEILKWRTVAVRVGSVFFGLALVLAASSPIVSERYRNRMTPASAITFAVDSIGVLSAGFEGRRLVPLTLTSLSLSGSVATGLVAPAIQGRTDSTGNVSLRLPAIRLTGGAGPFEIRASWQETVGPPPRVENLPIVGIPPPPP